MSMVRAGGAARRRRAATAVGSAAPSYGRGLRWPSCHKRTLPGRTNAAGLQARRRVGKGGGGLLSGYNALPAARGRARGRAVHVWARGRRRWRHPAEWLLCPFLPPAARRHGQGGACWLII
jgi:hypothetical protein